MTTYVILASSKTAIIPAGRKLAKVQQRRSW
jgi:hypothetical protein